MRKRNCSQRWLLSRRNFIGFLKSLQRISAAIREHTALLDAAYYLRDIVLTDMEELRKIANSMEEIMPAEFYPYPTYGDLLFSVL